MATRNGERFLAEQIESVRYQTHEDWRLLISDDCSEDGTLAIADRYATLDSRIQVVSRGARFGSAKANFFHLLDVSDADYVMFCDQDDVWLDDKVERSLDAMSRLKTEEQRIPALIFADMAVVDEGLGLISSSFEQHSRIDSSRTQFRQVLAQSIGAGCAMTINRSLVELALDGRSRIDDIIMHDWWISLVAAAFGSIAHVDCPLSLYRQHDGNSVGAVKYGIGGTWLRATDMTRSVERMIRQARAFKDTYFGNVEVDAAFRVEELATVGEGAPLESLIHLVKSGAWKSGLRKPGEAIGVFHLAYQRSVKRDGRLGKRGRGA